MKSLSKITLCAGVVIASTLCLILIQPSVLSATTIKGLALADVQNSSVFSSTVSSSSSSVSETSSAVTGVWDNILGFLGTPAIIVTVATICLTALFRAVIKVFQFGVGWHSNFDAKFASKDQEHQFESEIRQMINDSETRIKADVMRVCLLEINQQAQRINGIQETAGKVEADKTVIETKIKVLNDKYEQIASVQADIRNLNDKVNTLLYGNGKDQAADTRRVSTLAGKQQ